MKRKKIGHRWVRPGTKVRAFLRGEGFVDGKFIEFTLNGRTIIEVDGKKESFNVVKVTPLSRLLQQREEDS